MEECCSCRDRKMDIVSLHADLVALRKVYRLLETNGPSEGNSLSESLDEDSCLFLKRLLDTTAEKLIEDHLRILAAKWRTLISTSSLADQIKEAEHVQSSRPPVSLFSSRMFGSDNQYRIKNDPLASKGAQKDGQSSDFRPKNLPSTSASRPMNSSTDEERSRCLACEQQVSKEDTVTTAKNAPYKNIQLESQSPTPHFGYQPHLSTSGRRLELKVLSVKEIDILKNQGTREVVTKFEVNDTGSVEHQSPGTVAPPVSARKKHSLGSSRDMEVDEHKAASSRMDGSFSSDVDLAIKKIESLIPSVQRLIRLPPPPQTEEEAESSNLEFQSLTNYTDCGLHGICQPIKGMDDGGLVITCKWDPNSNNMKRTTQGCTDESENPALYPCLASCDERTVDVQEEKLLKNGVFQEADFRRTNNQPWAHLFADQDCGVQVDDLLGHMELADLMKHIPRSGQIPEEKEVTSRILEEMDPVDRESRDGVQSQTSRGRYLNKTNRTLDQDYPSRKVKKMKDSTATANPLDSFVRFSDPTGGNNFPNNMPKAEDPARPRKVTFPSNRKIGSSERVSNNEQSQPHHDASHTESESLSSWATNSPSAKGTTSSISSASWRTNEVQSTSSRSSVDSLDKSQQETSGGSHTSRSSGESSSGYTTSYSYNSSQGRDEDNNDGYYEDDAAEPSRHMGLSFRSRHNSIVGHVMNRQGPFFRRLKNKLGLIFHHHHHHHHHHLDNSAEATKEPPNARLLGKKQPSKASRLEGGDLEANYENPTGKGKAITCKTKTTTITPKMKRLGQVGHFQSLVDGLMRHIRQSKLAKDGGNQGIMRGHGGSKKMSWWQRIGKRRGMKVPSSKAKLKKLRVNDTARRTPRVSAVREHCRVLSLSL